MDVSNYRKAIGSILGGIVALLVSFGVVPDTMNQLVTPVATVIGSLIGTYLAPANQPKA